MIKKPTCCPAPLQASKIPGAGLVCADGVPTWGMWGPAKPSIFMPLWACRFNPTIFSVRVERLHSIDEGDIIAEGCPPEYLLGSNWYQPLWDKLNAGRGYPWSKNPWVFRVEFEKYEAGL
jgi:hypothetical protein